MNGNKNFLLGVVGGVLMTTAFFGFLIFGIFPHPQGVGAVTFDSDIVPVVGSSIRVGVSQNQISSINNTLFFDGGSIGIGATPQQTSSVRLHLEGGGLRFNNLSSQPACTPALRGMMWYTPGTGGVGDSLALCYWNGSTSTWATFTGK